jgi:NAD(P)-dependent dehydrogenase (short-subunit alcohol dehydrogenase family)
MRSSGSGSALIRNMKGFSRNDKRGSPRVATTCSTLSSPPADIAPLAVFLASDESAWITGEVIRAAGGLVVAT